jgi:DNA polymerase-4
MPHERNLVMSCSYEARARGVRPGMLLGEAARRCPEAVFRRGDAQAANRLRERAARILLGFTPLVEVASIDDFFCDLGGTERLAGPALEVAERMRAAIRAELALPVTVGVAANRTLARIAGKLAKPGGVAEIRPGYERVLLARLPVGHLPGVGRSIGPLLERFAIRTVGELALVSREILFASFGTPGLVLFERARGVDDEPVEPTYAWRAASGGDGGAWVPRAPRSIRRDSTFEPEEGRRAIVEAMLGYLVERAAHRLRGHRVGCGTLVVRLVHVDPRARVLREDPRWGTTLERRERLASPSDATDALWHHAQRLLRSFPRRRALVKRVGVTLTDLVPLVGWQQELFGPAADTRATSRGAAGSRADRHRRLDRALDLLRDKHGFGRVLRGTSFQLARTHELGPDGFRLRTPSLNQ